MRGSSHVLAAVASPGARRSGFVALAVVLLTACSGADPAERTDKTDRTTETDVEVSTSETVETSAPTTNAGTVRAVQVVEAGEVKLSDQTFESPPFSVAEGGVYFAHLIWSSRERQSEPPTVEFPGCRFELVESLFARPTATRMANVYEATHCSPGPGRLTVTGPVMMDNVALTVVELTGTDGHIEQHEAVDGTNNSTNLVTTLSPFAAPGNVTLFFASHGKGGEPIADPTGALAVIAHRENASLFSIATLFAPRPVLTLTGAWESASSPTGLALEVRALP